MKLKAVQQFNLICSLYNTPVYLHFREHAEYTLFAWKMDAVKFY